MIEWLLVCAVALVASALTLFAGFGLGTMLLPAFALFFPLELAVAATAVVHLANNLIKVSLLGRHADRTVLRRFGLPAIIAAISGARLLTDLSGAEPLATWTLGARVCHVTPIGLMIGGLMAIFALWDLVPRLARVSFPPRYLALGGLLSGFFGGLSGHQGALRSAFLVRAGLTPQAFIATGVVIACLVDVGRLAWYGRDLAANMPPAAWGLTAAASASAITGVVLANRFLPKVSMGAVRAIVAVMLFAMAILLGAGIV
jgi:uncharacterized membrane protein YfcA